MSSLAVLDIVGGTSKYEIDIFESYRDTVSLTHYLTVTTCNESLKYSFFKPKVFFHKKQFEKSGLVQTLMLLNWQLDNHKQLILFRDEHTFNCRIQSNGLIDWYYDEFPIVRDEIELLKESCYNLGTFVNAMDMWLLPPLTRMILEYTLRENQDCIHGTLVTRDVSMHWIA